MASKARARVFSARRHDIGPDENRCHLPIRSSNDTVNSARDLLEDAKKRPLEVGSLEIPGTLAPCPKDQVKGRGC